MADSLADAMKLLNTYRAQRISVVSKQDNRFEGLLKVIHTDNRSICMEKVRFCGTERRSVIGHVQSARMELYTDITIRLDEIKEIFAHIERSPEMCLDPAVIDSGSAITPILWSTVCLPNNKQAFVLPTPPDQRVQRYTAAEKNPPLNIPGALKVLMEQAQRPEKPQASFISVFNMRYEGTLKDVDQNDKSVSLTNVRFWGTEDRPSIKMVVPRDERYPSVRFQLDQLKYIRISVAMCQDMFEDTAVMVDQSSQGIIEIDAECPLPIALQTAPLPPRNVTRQATPQIPPLNVPRQAAPQMPPNNVTLQTSPEMPRRNLTVQTAPRMPPMNAPLQIAPEMPPSDITEPDAGNLSDSALSVESHGTGSTDSPNQRRVRFRTNASIRVVSPRTTRSVSQPRASMSAGAKARAQSQVSLSVVENGSTRRRSGSMVPSKTVGLARRGRGRPRLSGRPNGILKNATAVSPEQSAAGVSSDASGSEVGGEGASGNRAKNSCPETEDSGETVVFDIMWIDRSLQCPAADCTWKANNLYMLKCHFDKQHTEQYPLHELRLSCSLCPEKGFKGQIPTLRKHMESVHQWEDGYPPNDTSLLSVTATETPGGSGSRLSVTATETPSRLSLTATETLGDSGDETTPAESEETVPYRGMNFVC